MLTYGRRLPIAELFARIDAVDEDTVKRVASRFIYDKVCDFYPELLAC
jgi:processing peptidase subunit beta